MPQPLTSVPLLFFLELTNKRNGLAFDWIVVLVGQRTLTGRVELPKGRHPRRQRPYTERPAIVYTK